MNSELLQMIKELEASQFHLILSRVGMHCLASVVTLGSAILLLRTANGTLKSRFLRHLAMSIFLTVAWRVGSIVYLLLKAGLAFLVVNKVTATDPIAASFAQTLSILESTWHGIDITMSLLSSLFLFAAWNILSLYPNHEGVSRSLFTILTALFGGGVLAVVTNVLVIAEKIQPHLWVILDVVDLLSATISLWLVGWQLQKSLGPNMKTENSVLRATLPWMTTFAYFIWGVSQPFYPLLKPESWYSALLLISGMSALLLTIILCSQSLDEKPEYNSAYTPIVNNGDDSTMTL